MDVSCACGSIAEENERKTYLNVELFYRQQEKENRNYSICRFAYVALAPTQLETTSNSMDYENAQSVAMQRIFVLFVHSLTNI